MLARRDRSGASSHRRGGRDGRGPPHHAEREATRDAHGMRWGEREHRSVPAAPGEDTQHGHAEHDERQDLATVHWGWPSPGRVARRLAHRALPESRLGR